MQINGRFGAPLAGSGRFRDGRFAGTNGAPGQQATPFGPGDLFASGEKGGAWDFGAAAPFGTAIASVPDLSGNANDLTQTSASRQPVSGGVATAVGPVLNSDPDLTGGAGWITGAGWVIAGGLATKTAGAASSLSQAVPLSPGRLYVVHVDATRSAGTLQIRLTGGSTVNGYQFNESRSHTDHLIAAAGNDTLEVFADAGFAGTVKSLRIQEATETGFHGAFFDGSDSYLRNGAVDLSGSQRMTVVAGFWRDDKHGNLCPMDVGGYTGTAVPGAMRLLNHSRVDMRDATGSRTLNGEGLPPTKDTRVGCVTIAIDYSAPDQARLRQRGVETGASTATGLSVPDLPGAGPIAFGAAGNGALDWRGVVARAIVINRSLSPAEIADAENWVLGGSAVRGAVLGDSTIAANSATSGQPAETWRVAAFLPEAEFGAADLSLPGHKMFQQANEWAALADKSALDFVILQVGLNDANTYALTKSSPTLIAEMQALVDTVRADVAPACKIYVAALTPCRGWLGNSTDPAAAYAHWLAINQAIEGLGPTPIGNVDGRIVPKTQGRYWGALSDASDFLLETYDHNGDGVHPDNAGRLIVADGWRSQLRADGVI